MLFDLRGRGRRRTVQAVYLGLALLMGGGLVLFGVGAGNGFGGILNAFTGNGSGSAQKQVVSQQEKAALRAVKARPRTTPPPGASSSRLAGPRPRPRAPTSTPPPAPSPPSGKQGARLAPPQAWQKYLTLTNKADPTVAILAARAYAQLGDYAHAGQGLGDRDARDQPTSAKGYECLAAAAYAAKQTPQGRSRRRQGPEPRAQGPAADRQASAPAGQDQPPNRPAVLSA